jgi:hypothetical protein
VREITATNCTAVHLLAKVSAMNTLTVVARGLTMGAPPPNPPLKALPMGALPAHILQALACAQSEGRPSSLDSLTEELRVRRGDVRRTVTLLHRRGFVDALRMRLTLSGFALGRAYLGQTLPPLRRVKTADSAAA